MRELLGAVLVGALELFAETLQKARNGSIFGERIQSSDELDHLAQLCFEYLDEPLTVRGAQLLEQRTGVADLPRQGLRENAVLGREVLLQQSSEDDPCFREGAFD